MKVMSPEMTALEWADGFKTPAGSRHKPQIPVDDLSWEPEEVTLQVRFCEGGGTYRVTGIPAATHRCGWATCIHTQPFVPGERPQEATAVA